MRVAVQPALLDWACHRAGKQPGDLSGAFPKIMDWLAGTAQPTLKQLERFAARTHTPIGFLFLQEPPVERVPIPDMRTMGSVELTSPSPDLLDTLYLCQQRQNWFRDYAQTYGLDRPALVASRSIDTSTTEAAAALRDALELTIEVQMAAKTWEAAFRTLVSCIDDAGILVMISGIVGVNTHRALDPEEFRGFALADDVAPLVFVNGADSKAAQMFTLAHELAHILVGETALSDVPVASATPMRLERWCNAVAAEFLVPSDRLDQELDHTADPLSEARRLARRFRVSTLVMLRRLHDLGRIGRDEMWRLYRAELALLQSRKPKSSSGGNFYATQRTRVGRRFARAVIESTWEGRSTFTEANRMLNVKKVETLMRLAAEVGLEVA